MKILKEIIISLLICLAILLGLGLAFYKFIPNNKIIPETIKYQASEEVQKELNIDVDKDNSKVIKTYEITASDLEKYRKNNEYVPGRENPFAPITYNDDSDGEATNDQDNTSSNTSNGTNNSGSLFDIPGSK